MSVRLIDIEDLVILKIEQEQWTHKDLSEYFKKRFPNIKGASIRSIERFCNLKNIHKTSRPTYLQLNNAVSRAVHKVNYLIKG